MQDSWLIRVGALCGVLCGLLIAVPGAVEAFTGETAPTSFALAFAPALGLPLLTAFHLRQQAVAGRSGAVAYLVNLVGLGLFSGAGFTLNMVLFYLDEQTLKDLMAGPTKFGLLAAAGVFTVGTVLFGLSMLRARVFPRIPSWGYTVALSTLALLAPLPDSVFTSTVHVLAGASLLWLSLFLRSSPATSGADGSGWDSLTARRSTS